MSYSFIQTLSRFLIRLNIPANQLSLTKFGGRLRY